MAINLLIFTGYEFICLLTVRNSIFESNHYVSLIKIKKQKQYAGQTK